MPSLYTTYCAFTSAADKLSVLLSGISTLPPLHRKLVAELILLRLFSLLVDTIQSTAAKLLCGAHYLDGTLPHTLIPSAKSNTAALELIRTHGRAKPLKYLKWNMPSQVYDNVQYVIHHNDNICAAVTVHALHFKHMCLIRHHIAHSQAHTRKLYRDVVQHYYGAYLPAMTPGRLLMSARHSPSILARYISFSRIFVKQMLKA